LTFFLFSILAAFSQRPTIQLTFTAEYNNLHVPLDSILIQNLTQPGDTMLFAPDTVLFLDYVSGIPDNGGTAKSSFSVSPNYPNPSVDGKTSIDVFIPERENITMRIVDIRGSEVASYENTLDAGNHHFTFLAGKEKYYVLSVNCGNENRSIKMINSGNSNQMQGILIYQGSTETESSMKSQEATAGFDFSLGDQLQFTAYANGYLLSIIIDIPESNKTYTFELVSSVFTCGSSITINHLAGEVAPVNKTVTYGTVTNIPGEPSKCWITSNLGADHQATAKNDATEPSAGWYWQFNRKQGYKHTGSVRTPNTPWITSISEDSDWQVSNDPCALELGAGWRIPTSFEWNNVRISGNWANWDGPWNSGLKLHAAGFLHYAAGSLDLRGAHGRYWSSLQTNADYGRDMIFGSGFSMIYDDPKAAGFTLRCIREENSSTIPVVTTAGITNISQTTATGGGEVTDDGGADVTARGVCWSTSQNPTIADNHTEDGTGTGVFVSQIAGLTPNTPYFVRAYATNSVGTAYGNEVNFTTLATGFVCGSPLTINHVTGEVAPVDKTVTYGTVNNIPGEESKCWITSNLGSDHQATAVSDATEPSAGWYWQFNRKQGYKHDGTTRTPNTTWIYPISENSDWIPANDPCALELGSGWRIPTKTEWTNVDASGNWTNWNGPWNSGLKMHAAGYLFCQDGSLSNRGSYGASWSSTQNDASNSWSLDFYSSISYMGNFNKASGLTARCITEASVSTIPTVSTSDVVDIAQTTATGGGNVTADGGALVTDRGVCWSTSQNPTIDDNHTSDGTGTGTFVSNLTGLTPNTPYFVRAYATNSVGMAYGNEVNFTTLSAGFTCGSTITINHVTGNVAPVDKTVTYGTVTNIPGEESKCWITSNLGADHQATAVSDATEPSAGWYWQFNRKQGYKHTGSVRTPNTTWINPISENSDWIPANDPCSLELGSGWRVPTQNEWTNVHASGNWTDWNGPWNSALKMHAAGYLIFGSGSLLERGSGSAYWSSTQYDASYAWYLFFLSSNSGVTNYRKANGFSARCIKE
jgi:hypothetical protein